MNGLAPRKEYHANRKSHLAGPALCVCVRSQIDTKMDICPAVFLGLESGNQTIAAEKMLGTLTASLLFPLQKRLVDKMISETTTTNLEGIMKRVIVLVCGIVLLASTAYAQLPRDGEKISEFLQRQQREAQQRKLIDSQIELNEALANQARQQNNNKKYELKYKGSRSYRPRD